MVRRFAAFVAFSLCVSSVWGQAPSDGRASSFSVVGEGRAAARPDIATMTFSVIGESRDAADALDRQRKRSAAILAAIRDLGIEERDVVAGRVSIQPRIAYPSGNVERIEGYMARNEISITLREIDRAGAAFDALVKAGVNDTEGFSFDFTNREALLDEARRRAAADARRKADLYAAALGVRVVQVRSLTEAPSVAAEPASGRRRRGEEGSEPASTGERNVQATITATFEIEPQ